jgi:hypothetical protein
MSHGSFSFISLEGFEFAIALYTHMLTKWTSNSSDRRAEREIAQGDQGERETRHRRSSPPKVAFEERSSEVPADLWSEIKQLLIWSGSKRLF